MYKVSFDAKVAKIISKWKKSNPNLHKKLLKVVISIAENPRKGIGHPEPLVGGGDRTYSRHITAHDRIIYDIYDDEVVVIVIELEGHYGDK
ncbi:MAG: Txe/YoeB family addiction module toxin [Muribaculaceae bacterium]|nr:Txe/YoeB family addiction module toxin [Muribaculaceae bacterium]